MATLQQKIDEFCLRGNLESYRQVLTSIFQRILSEGCNIAAFYTNDQTKHSDAKPCIIKIRLSYNQSSDLYAQPEEIIWSILHEFGHHLDGKPDSDQMMNPHYVFEREKQAWKYAESEIDRYEDLRNHIGAFNTFKEKNLQTYSPNI